MDNKVLTYLNDSSNRMVLDWLGFFQEYDFETHFKRGVLNVLPHELLHMYAMLELDHGLKKPGLGDGGGVVGEVMKERRRRERERLII